MRSAHTNTHTTRHSSQEWQGGAETRAQACTPTPHTPARSGGVHAEHAHGHTRTPQHPSQQLHVQPKPQSKGTHPHHTPKPGVAGYRRSTHTNTHTPKHPGQEWQGAAETRAQAHTPPPHTPASSGGVQTERANKQTHIQTPQPGVVGRSRDPSPSARTHAAHPSQDGRGKSRGRTQTHTHPNTPVRSGGAQPKPEPKRSHKHRHTPQHPSQEWRRDAETRAKAHTTTPRTPARSGGVQAEHTHKHPHMPTPQPGVAGRSRNRYPSTPIQDPSQGWRGYRETQIQTQAPHDSRKPSVHSPRTEAARAMQVTRDKAAS